MITKLFILGLLCSTVIQAFPTDNKAAAGGNVPCIKQIEWVENSTLESKKMYDEYYEALKKNNIIVTDEIKHQHDEINAKLANEIKKYTADKEKLSGMRANVSEQWDICKKELKEFSLLNSNLSAITQGIRPKIVGIAKNLGLPQDTVDDLDHTLGRVVNFMFIIDLGKNTFRDVFEMIKEASIKTVDGIKLEEKYKFTEDGVEALGELEEREVIGNIENPAEHVIKPIDEPHNNGRGTEYNTNEWDKPGEDDKALEDLLKDDPEIKEAEKGLEEREARQLAETQAEQKALKEQELKQEQEARELQAQRELEERELIFRRPPIGK